MLDLDEQLTELRTWPATPPVSPRQVRQVHVEAHRRTLRRRTALGLSCGAAAIAIAAIGTSLVKAGAEREQSVIAGPSEESAANALLADPAADLEDGATVTVKGDFVGAAVTGVGQCAAAASKSPDPLLWCDINVPWTVSGPNELIVTVTRRIHPPSGVIDCGDQRCLLGVRTPEGDLFAGITFSSTGQPSTPVLKVDRTSLLDGDTVTVAGEGFVRNTEIYLSLCLAGDTAAPDPGTRCDLARGVRPTSDGDGNFTVSFTAFAEAFLQDGWARCSPCELRAQGYRVEPAVLPVELRTVGPPIRPSVTVDPSGPYEPDQIVRLRGKGFAPGSEPYAGWCAFRSDSPETESQGSGSGHATCLYPNEGFGASVDATGSFVIDVFPMPTAGFGADCIAGTARCGLAWHPGEGTPPAFVTEFELEG